MTQMADLWHAVDVCEAAADLRRTDAPAVIRHRIAAWEAAAGVGPDDLRQALRRMRSALRAASTVPAAPHPGDLPTAETVARQRRRRGVGAILALQAQGRLHRELVAVAEEIAWLVESVAGIGAKAAPLVRIGTGGPGEISQSAAYLHARVYRPWAAALVASGVASGKRRRGQSRPIDGRARLAIVLAAAVDGVSVAELRRRHRCDDDAIVGAIRTGLERYEDLRGRVRRPR